MVTTAVANLQTERTKSLEKGAPLAHLDSQWSFPSCSHPPHDRTFASSSCDFRIICWGSLEKWFKNCHFQVLQLFSHKADIYFTPFCVHFEVDGLPASSHFWKIWLTIVLSVVMVIGKVLKKGEKNTRHTMQTDYEAILTSRTQTSLSSHHLTIRAHPSSRTHISTVWETVTDCTEIWLSFVKK